MRRFDSSHYFCAVLSAFSLLAWSGCKTPMNANTSPQARRDINAVLADHDKQLMAIPGVVGVYVGVLPDQRTSCLKVMLARNDPAAKKNIPKTLEGYPVITEVTGKIEPMK